MEALCTSCLPLLKKWTPNVDELATFTFSPWVIQSSVSPLGVNLADMLRSRLERRQAALSLLRHLGKEVDSIAGVLLDDISETEWAATVSSSSNVPSDTVSDQRSNSRLIRGAQHFVQQCLNVRIPEVPLEKCILAEMDGRRSYPLVYASPTEVPLVPDHPLEAMRETWITRYRLEEVDLSTEEVALVCDLVAKEMEAAIGVATVVMRDKQWFIPPVRSDEGVVVNERKQSFSSHSLLTGKKPFLVRNAQLDVRFRNYNVVTAKNNLQFYFGVPILAGDGVVVATLCALDTQPRKSITTMQYSVMTALAQVISSVWKETFVPEEGRLAKEIEVSSHGSYNGD
ncbi:hypothetical protein BBP00_00005476 [Phytophthora kernoviae]|uniref:GAF domain-containing protein n=1 Tax=Phytophthora kernoviae TaxID=325452 RepID=A0A3F2RNS0_9STRA|nr:hypothetical protein BBP00_00005476 [Phytophthora kernoviae]